jgi:leucyl-tRNA synthetase
MPYDPATIEPKWQRHWEEHGTFRTPDDLRGPKYYVLDMFPYPSGAGLHVGHGEGYTATDIIARYKRMRGFNVLHPMGWDAFGLPTERAAVREGRHPAEITRRNTDNFRRQIRRLGFSYDWTREIDTSSPDYYRWTQWIFLKLHERGLAYQAEVPVNWCPALGTVLANEEVSPEGTYKETGDPVERRLMRQWMLRITAYAERLLADLDLVDWPEPVKKMQREWIGRSEGALVRFPLPGSGRGISVFTTRPDTLYGVTYLVLAPEHPLVAEIAEGPAGDRVRAYVDEASRRSERDRRAQSQQKTGVETGLRARHPLTGADLPVWVADYVLGGYGTGAVMAVPAHDQRDFEFAERMGLPLRVVVRPEDADLELPLREAFTGDGIAVDSGPYTGLGSGEFRRRVTGDLARAGLGEAQVHYALRDWLFSRQRYWGEPFPIVIAEDGTAVPVPEDSLPVTLPHLDDFRPAAGGEPPLARAESWRRTTDPRTGRPALRETHTMPQWAGSCWYYLRFLDPHNDREPWSAGRERYWMPVDLYVGGVEHAVLHLLYARFWHKVLFDAGLVSTPEPFQKLFNQGMILAHSYQDASGRYHLESDTEIVDGERRTRSGARPVRTQVEKMSKSRLNVVSPDEVIDAYGADSMRLYEMFLGPLDATKPWQTRGIEGVHRFLHRAWRLLLGEDEAGLSPSFTSEAPEDEERKALARTIAGVTEDIEALRFNTAIAKMMELVNFLASRPRRARSTAEALILLLAPFAPHWAEELWSRIGHAESLARHPWPQYEPEDLRSHEEEIPVCVNGKVRARIRLPVGAPEAAARAGAESDPELQRFLAQGRLLRTVYVPGRMLNYVVKGG